MTSYQQCFIKGYDEGLIALLSDFGFDSFEEQEDTTIAYIDAVEVDEINKIEIGDLISSFGFSYEWKMLADENWNALWEANFEAVNIEDICRIRAEFHDHDPSYAHEIVIQPKMAFGTGHHQTTYMMIQTMNAIDFKNKKVFDYGCGTGILAIFASMLGAKEILAIDIEEESYLNTLENAVRNKVNNIDARQAVLENSALELYDIILANINRNVLLASTDQLAQRLENHGVLLLSGILKEDEASIVSAFEHSGFQLVQKVQRDQWLCLKMTKSQDG